VSARGSLTIAGTGIRLVGQVTLETLDHIKRADRLLYLAGDQATARWLQQINPSAESLSDCYAEGRPRERSYERMTERILQPLREGHRVSAIFYGHPGVGVDPAHAAIKRAREEGYSARMLAGISAEACLIAELEVDPLAQGWQSHEAWAFVVRRPVFDDRCPLVLWQIGLVFQASIDFSGAPDRRGLRALTKLLRLHYPASHQVVLYDASPFPVCQSRIERIALRDLPQVDVRMSTTLYIPAIISGRRRGSKAVSQYQAGE
jgi:uncharacterized protein YabN with tetrapyrrole methylase and pyrophosphatase domain